VARYYTAEANVARMRNISIVSRCSELVTLILIIINTLLAHHRKLVKMLCSYSNLSPKFNLKVLTALLIYNIKTAHLKFFTYTTVDTGGSNMFLHNGDIYLAVPRYNPPDLRRDLHRREHLRPQEYSTLATYIMNSIRHKKHDDNLNFAAYDTQ
jgi:hypothetical protein